MEPCTSWWTRTAESCAAPYAGLPLPAPSCSESSKRTVSCQVEVHSDGTRWRRCKELNQQFRICAGRLPEEISMSAVETLEPLLEAAESRGSGDIASAAKQQVVPVEVGRLLDEFFEFANELERNLSTSGTLHPSNEQEGHEASPPLPASGGFLRRFFGKKSAAEGIKQSRGDMELFTQFASGPSQEI